jgi:hypothetical protein
VDRVLDAVRRLDPPGTTEDPESVWIELIGENSV